MANITTNTHAPSHGVLGGFFHRILEAMVQLTEANQRVRKAEALQSLSDEELAAKGLKREDIARHVFGDMFYV